MARVTHVKKARKTYRGTGIKKGDSYYWWKFAFGNKIKSKTKPRQSQLTQSAYMSTLYGIQEQIEDGAFTGHEDGGSLEVIVGDIVGELEELKSTTEESFDNMPEQLQDAETGQLLQERIDTLESIIGELEGVDCHSFNEEDVKLEAKQEVIDEINQMGEEKDFTQKQVEEKIDELYEEKRTEKFEEIAQELEGIDIDVM